MADRMNQGGGIAERQRGQDAAAGVFGTVAGAAQGAASSVASAAEQAWETISGDAQQAASAVVHTAEDAWGSMRSCMSRYPIATFFAGVGVGALAVMALRRR
jgi:phage-related protein